MIEVKSEYTYALDYVREKAHASREAGYTYEFWVYSRNSAPEAPLSVRVFRT